jgi:endonuclease/exonuclease/phosphatase family metal-dependent hydrolase
MKILKQYADFSFLVTMKLWAFSVTFFLLISCGPSPSGKNADQHPGSNRLSVAAYNVRVGRNATAKEIGEALKPYDLDIVCFSEAPGGDWTSEAAEILGMENVIVGRYTTAGHKDKYKTIASRTPMYGYEEILMADTLHTVTRALTSMGGREIAIYSVHFPRGWRDQAHIDETTGKITAFIDYLKERPVSEIALLLGDFNFVPSNPDTSNMYHQMFVDIGLEISWKDLGMDLSQRNTARIFKPEEERPGHVIDHIMYNPEKMQALDGGIIEMDTPLSDHKPVWALLELKE